MRFQGFLIISFLFLYVFHLYSKPYKYYFICVFNSSATMRVCDQKCQFCVTKSKEEKDYGYHL